VARAGITHVAGALIGDTTRYRASHYPPGWAVDDVPYGYAAVPAALSYDLNVAHVRVSPGAAPGLPAILHVAPADGAFAIENATVTGIRGSDDTTDVKRAWEQPQTIRVVGSYPLGAPLSDDLEPSLPDPAAYALAAFGQALAQHGVRVDGAPRLGAVPADARVLWSHDSKPLAGVLADCWQPSLNLLAEQMLLALGAGAPGDMRVAGIAVEKAWLQSIGIDPATLTIADGSGLSAYDRVTPRDLVAILQTDWQGPQRAAVLAALPLAGVRGTLQSTFSGTPLAGNVYAKTGTVNHSRLLAGYVDRPNADPVTFAIMINDWMDDSPAAAAALDAVWAQILEALRA
jgi:D-alanyl-D-alanine carboxypeptidase/D-alanyl-D-alanine-endopeptidase (penicillin-binding protein 4)